METRTVKAGEGTAGIVTGGERTLKAAKKPDAVEAEKVPLPETDAELEKRRKGIAVAMGWEMAEKDPETPLQPAVPAVASPTPPAEGAAPAADAAATPAVSPPKPEALDAEQLIAKTAAAVGQQVGKAISDAQPAPAPAAPAEPGPAVSQLTHEDARDLEIIAKMEEIDPSLKGKAEEFREFALARYDYEADWKSKNPGRAYNPDDDDHAEFYKGQPEIDQELFDAAKIELIVDRKVAKRMQPIEEETRARTNLERSEKTLRDAQPTIAQNVNTRVVETVQSINEELGKLFKDGDKIDLGEARVEQLRASDPVAARIIEPMVMGEVIPLIAELEKSVIPGLGYPLDPGRNPVHKRIAEFVDKFESDVAAQPNGKNQRDGKEFQTIAQRNFKVNDIMGSNLPKESKERRIKEIDERYWTASVDDIEDAIVADVSRRARKEIEDFDKAARRKYKPDATAPVAAVPAESAIPLPSNTPAAAGKPRPPSVASQTTVVDNARSGTAAEKSFGETAVATHWGR